MRATMLSLVLALQTAAAVLVHAQGQSPAIRGQIPDLGRPTRGDDPLPLFDFDLYFLGSWTFEWEVPDGPLGPGGTLKGTTTYRSLNDGFYEATTDAVGSEGPITWKETISYRRESKVVDRHVTDSRGFSLLQAGTIGGDLGGYYTIRYDSAPFTVDGRTIRLRSTLSLVSPVNFRTITTMSIDGGRFSNYGTSWSQKNVSTEKK